MLYVVSPPARPLGEFVDSFWQLSDAQAARKERILPSGTVELVVNLQEDEVRIYDPTAPNECDRFPGSVLSGAYSRPFICDAMQHQSMVGVHFKPGGASRLLGAVARDLSDTHVDLATLWGRAAVELRERLCEAATPMARFQVMEQFLVDHLDPPPATHHWEVLAALDAFQTRGSRVAVRDVAREVGLSQRRFIEVFRDEVGLTPKRFCRLLRFQRVLELAEPFTIPGRSPESQIEDKPKLNWSRLAADCGYADQSHLIHEFEEFSGLRPRQYLHQKRQEGWAKDGHVPSPR